MTPPWLAEMERARREALAARALVRIVAVLGALVVGAVVAVSLLAGCARPTPPAAVELPADASAEVSPTAAGDPCDCAHALAACAPSGYRCGVGVACADGIPYRRADGGLALVSRACPVPVTDRGRVVALCLDGDACIVDGAAEGATVQ